MTLRQVLVGVVSHTGTADLWFCQALSESVKLCLAHDIALTMVPIRSQGNSTMGYNRLLTAAWKSEASGLLLVSPEVYWEPRALLDAVTSNKDALALPVSSLGGFQVQLGEIPRLQTDKETGEIKVLGAGLGFLLLSQEAVKKLCETHPTISFEGEEVKLVLQHGDTSVAYFSDADVLAHRLKEAGVEVWLNPAHTVNAVTPQAVTGDFAAALKEAQGG